jgi:hypothetical protein
MEILAGFVPKYLRDFSNKKQTEIINYWYQRASKTPDLFGEELCCNKALFKSSQVAYGATHHYFQREIRNKVISTNIDVLAHYSQKDIPIENQMVIRDASEKLALQSSNSTQQVYKALRNLSEQDANCKLIIAWILLSSNYVEEFTEEQAVFWETDFEILKLLENVEGKLPKKTKIRIQLKMNLTEFKAKLSKIQNIIVEALE